MASKKKIILTTVLVSSLALIVILITVSANKEFKIQKFVKVIEKEAEKPNSEVYLKLKNYFALKREAFKRFLKSKNGSEFVCKKIETFFGFVRMERLSNILPISPQEEARWNFNEMRASAILMIEDRIYYSAVFEDEMIYCEIENDLDTKFFDPSIVNEKFEQWDENLKEILLYVSLCGGLDSAKNCLPSNVEIYNVEKNIVPTWYKELNWPDRGLLWIWYHSSVDLTHINTNAEWKIYELVDGEVFLRE